MEKRNYLRKQPNKIIVKRKVIRAKKFISWAKEHGAFYTTKEYDNRLAAVFSHVPIGVKKEDDSETVAVLVYNDGRFKFGTLDTSCNNFCTWLIRFDYEDGVFFAEILRCMGSLWG